MGLPIVLRNFVTFRYNHRMLALFFYLAFLFDPVYYFWISDGEFLVMHLAELVRMAFIAGTSNNDQLKLAGIKTLFVSFEFCLIFCPFLF